MKIVYVIPGASVCGGIRIIFEQANRLVERGHEVYILNQARSEQNWFKLKARIISEEEMLIKNPDIIVATFWTTVEYIEKLNIKAKRFYLIQGKESLFYGDDYKKMVEKTYFRSFDILTISKTLKNWLLEKYGLKSTLVRNGINFEDFHKSRKLPRKSKKLVVLIEGNSSFKQKNIQLGMKVLDDLKKYVEIWMLANEKFHFDEKIDREFINPKQDLLKNIYSSADVLFKPSLLEGLSCPIMEAMACGIATVASNILPIHELITDGKNGIIAKTNTEQGYKNAFIRLIANRELLEKIKKNALKESKKFIWKPTIDILETTFLNSLPIKKTENMKTKTIVKFRVISPSNCPYTKNQYVKHGFSVILDFLPKILEDSKNFIIQRIEEVIEEPELIIEEPKPKKKRKYNRKKK